MTSVNSGIVDGGGDVRHAKPNIVCLAGGGGGGKGQEIVFFERSVIDTQKRLFLELLTRKRIKTEEKAKVIASV